MVRKEIRMHKDLTLPHMQPLVEFVLRMRDRYVDGYVPNFDPDDGGVNAEILFLFEKPGPKTDPTEGGSGFISQDNNDPTAKATKDFLLKAGVDRKKLSFGTAYRLGMAQSDTQKKK